MTTRAYGIALAIAATGLAAPSHAGPSAVRLTPEAPQPAAAEPELTCPDALRGVEISLEPADRGVAFEFTQVPGGARGRLKELRGVLREAAGLLQEHSLEMATQMVSENTGLAVPPVHIKVTDTRAGARVVVRAKHVQHVKELRRQALVFEQFWDRFECVDRSPKPAI